MKNKLEAIECFISELTLVSNITINEETNLSDIPGWDDLDTAELSMLLEDEFDIEFMEDEYNEINNIGKLIELIETKTK